LRKLSFSFVQIYEIVANGNNQGAAHDVSKSYRKQIVDKEGKHGNGGSTDSDRLENSCGNEIHIGNAVLKSAEYENCNGPENRKYLAGEL
jgi:hypothetical protein